MPRPLRVLVLLAFGLAGIAAGTADANAQQQLDASVTVLPAPVGGSGVRTLRFETVAPGTPKTVLPGENTTSGKFEITGLRHANNVQITFTLPAALRHTVFPASTIPLDFNGDYAQGCLQRNGNQAPACAAWNPTSQFTHNFEATPPGQRSGTYALYIGGRAVPGPTPRAGNYTEQITITFVVN